MVAAREIDVHRVGATRATTVRPCIFGTGFTHVCATESAFAALTPRGQIRAWGNCKGGGDGFNPRPEEDGMQKRSARLETFQRVPAGSNFIAICSTKDAFAALTATGEVQCWGNTNGGHELCPPGAGCTAIVATSEAFAALNTEGGAGRDGMTGTVAVWGSRCRNFCGPHAHGGAGTTANNGHIQGTFLIGNNHTALCAGGLSMAALTDEGEIVLWGCDIGHRIRDPLPAGRGACTAFAATSQSPPRGCGGCCRSSTQRQGCHGRLPWLPRKGSRGSRLTAVFHLLYI